MLFIYYFDRMLSIPLPPAAQDNMCRFVWWQPLHSGEGRDMWAIDDISITATMYNTIDVGFDPSEDDQHALEIHLGEISPYCGKQQVLRFGTVLFDMFAQRKQKYFNI